MRISSRWLAVCAAVGVALSTGLQFCSVSAQSRVMPTPAKGNLIVFQSMRDATTQLWTMKADGSDQHQLTTTPNQSNQAPAWSPDGSQIVYVRSENDGSKPQLWIMDSDGTHQHMLLDQGESPSWSPDGKQIAFLKTSADRTAAEIDLVNPDSTKAHALVTDQEMVTMEPLRTGEFMPWTLAWSPDSNRIVFQQSLGGMMKYAIYVVNRDGSGLHKVADDGGGGEPTWSPDGKAIVAASAGAGKVFIVEAIAAGARTRTLSGAEDYDYQPAWSPDGKQIAVISSIPNDDGQVSLVVMATNGKNRKRVTSGISITKVIWSPDGSRIGFQSQEGDKSQIYSVDTDGKNLKLLSDGAGYDSDFEWQP